MKRVITVIGAIFLTGLLAGTAIGSDKVLKMSTTTSTQSSGLLDLLLPEFEKDTAIKVKVIIKNC